MEEFLSRNTGGKEPGAIIVTDDHSSSEVFATLTAKGFVFANNSKKLSDLLHAGGKIVVTSDKIERDPEGYFDVIQGFVTGSIDMDDEHTVPHYENSNTVLVLTGSFVEVEIEKGRNWMSLCGMAFQYPTLV